MKIARIAIASLSLLATVAHGAEPVAATVNLAWNPPTANTDGSPLTDLKEIKVYADTATIPDTSTAVPVRVPAGTNTSVYRSTVPNGTTLYFRLKACNAVDVCSAMGNELSRKVAVLIPGVPTGFAVSVTVTINVPAGS